MNREEHLNFAKHRAKQYLEVGRVQEAFDSFASDLQGHEELKNHSALGLGLVMIMNGHLSDPVAMEKFIDGFN